ncbi:MAG: hypothetical protein JWP22_3006 [Ramlibacter sp.]|nr:hypothetical protein [Ramlibacter sp.]
MKFHCRVASLLLPVLLWPLSGAQAAAAPAFDVAYRAWDVVTDVARHNGDPRISGDCGKTFRPFVTPALRRQSKQEQETAAVACHETARAVCADRGLRRTAEMAAKCEEFR